MRVAIAGYGIEGKANYDYWRGAGHEVTIVDEQLIGAHDLPYGADSMTGPGVLQQLGGFDMVVRTASMNPAKIMTNGTIWSATNEFFEKCPVPIIGVTGTKGKGTTCSLITSILRAAGKTVHLVGNIGLPALDVLSDIKPGDIVVYELSSFQLWDLKKSPHIAVVLMIEPEHLDVHKDIDDYVNAKSQIVAFQIASDICIYHPTNALSQRVANITSAAKMHFGDSEDRGVYVENTDFMRERKKLCAVSNLQLRGPHNIDNACAAITAALAYEPELEPSSIIEGLRSFDGLVHRIKLVAHRDGVSYYDDSYSSAPSASIAAMASFAEPQIVILGGYDRGLEFHDVAAYVAGHQDITCILIGQTATKIADSFKLAKIGNNRYEVLKTNDLADVINRARDIAKSGDIVLFSPGCASFDMFKDFTDRGEQFISLVSAL